MIDLDKVIDDGIKEVLEHESIKAANGAIALQAFRMGTGGYEGELLQEALRRFATKIIRAVKSTECPHFITPEGQARCVHCNQQ